jgi:hypothetical protein
MSGGVVRSHRDLALAGEAASLHSFKRLWRHYEAELSNDPAAVMKTVVADDNVLGVPIFWAVNADPEALGAEADRTKATIITGQGRRQHGRRATGRVPRPVRGRTLRRALRMANARLSRRGS